MRYNPAVQVCAYILMCDVNCSDKSIVSKARCNVEYVQDLRRVIADSLGSSRSCRGMFVTPGSFDVFE